MEKSLQRVEELVHATNSALAQMKFSLMFDDLDDKEGCRRTDAVGERRFRLERGEDFRQCQEVFTSEANEMVSKMEKMFGSKEQNTQISKALDRIKEINRKMNTIRQEHGELGVAETKENLQKLKGLVAEEESTSAKPDRGGTYSMSDITSSHRKEAQYTEKRPSKRADFLFAHSPSKSKEELKKNILETREIVDRGFHTARQLAQKVENMSKLERKEKTPISEKAENETNLKSFDGSSESKETTNRIKCGKHQKTMEKAEGEEAEGEEAEGEEAEGKTLGNAKLVDIRRWECRTGRRAAHLRTQRLPSVHIKRGLQLQRVHSLEISGQGDENCAKTNTGIHILSHDQFEKAKMERILEEVRRQNCCCYGVFERECRNALGNYVECPSCGKVLRIYRSTGAVDSRRLDEILKRCNFNVFDPRIDEFVEKYGVVGSEIRRERVPKVPAPEGSLFFEETEVEEIKEAKRESKRRTKKEGKKKKMDMRHFSLKELSSRLSVKYREEADALEGSHLRLDSLLRTLLSKIEESREALEECHLFRNERVLTATKPLVVSLTGSLDRKRRKQKLNKKDVKNRSKSRTGKGNELPSSLTLFTESPKTKEIEKMPLLCEGKENEVRSGKMRYQKATAESQSPSLTSSCQSVIPSKRELLIVQEPLLISTQSKEVEDGWTKLKETQAKVVPSPLAEQWESKKKSSLDVSMSTRNNRESEKIDFRAEALDGERNSPALVTISGDEGGEIEKVQSVVWGSNEEKVQSGASTERSDNHYESDFESSTNEPEEEPEFEVAVSTNKLSTISEVDSELERKVSGEQKTPRVNLKSQAFLEGPEEDIFWKNHQKKFDLTKPKKNNPLASEVSSRKAEDIPPRTEDTSFKSNPTELVTSLKDILSALKYQFARTETLAEKLTEKTKQEAIHFSPSREGIRSPWSMVEGLHSTRKEGGLTDNFSDEGGSSLGEVVLGDQRKGNCSFDTERSLPKPKKEGNGSFRGVAKTSWKLNESNVEVSYSEGEIPSNSLLDSECCSSHSVGEVHIS